MTRGLDFKKCLSKGQVIGLLRAEAGMQLKDLGWKCGSNQKSHYRWRSELGGNRMSNIKLLKDLDAENTRPRELLESQIFENNVVDSALRGVDCRDAVQPSGRSMNEKWLSELRTQRIVRMCASIHPYAASAWTSTGSQLFLMYAPAFRAGGAARSDSAGDQ